MEGLGECVEGLGECVEGLGECVEGLGECVEGLGECVEGLGECVEGLGECVEGLGECAEGLGECVEGLGECARAWVSVRGPGCLCVTLTWSSFLAQNFIEKPSRAVSDLYAAEIIHFKTIQVKTNYRHHLG